MVSSARPRRWRYGRAWVPAGVRKVRSQPSKNLKATRFHVKPQNFSLVHHLMVCTSTHWLQTVRRETSTYAETLRGQDVVPDESVLNAPRLPHPAPSGSGIRQPPTRSSADQFAFRSPSSSMGSHRRLVNKFDSSHIGRCFPPIAGV